MKIQTHTPWYVGEEIDEWFFVYDATGMCVAQAPSRPLADLIVRAANAYETALPELVVAAKQVAKDVQWGGSVEGADADAYAEIEWFELPRDPRRGLTMTVPFTIQRARAFWRGIAEFRSDLTTHFDDLALLEAYDWGREWAHRLTLRHWEG